MFTCKIWEKRVALDDFEQGEALKSNWCCVSLDFENRTLQGLLEEIANFFHVSGDSISAINGDGFISINRHENSDGETPTNQEIEDFLHGNCKLWSVDYQGVIQQTTEVSEAELNEALNNIE